MKPLSARQAEVVERVAKGLSDKQIAYELDISVYTVMRHLQEAAKKVPGAPARRYRLALFFLNIQEPKEKAG